MEGKAFIQRFIAFTVVLFLALCPIRIPGSDTSKFCTFE